MTFASILIRFVFIDWKKFNFEAFMTVEESVLILFHEDDQLIKSLRKVCNLKENFEKLFWDVDQSRVLNNFF